jgi:hypothetical protein
MPPYSPAQIRLFQAAAHNPEIAKRTKIPQETASKMIEEGTTAKERSAAVSGKSNPQSLEKQRAQARALRNQD